MTPSSGIDPRGQRLAAALAASLLGRRVARPIPA